MEIYIYIFFFSATKLLLYSSAETGGIYVIIFEREETCGKVINIVLDIRPHRVYDAINMSTRLHNTPVYVCSVIS